MFKELIYKSAAREPLVRYWRKTRLRGRTVVLTYHEIGEDGDEIEAWTVVRKSSFVEQIEYLRRHFDIVSLSEAIARMSHDGRGEAPTAVITLDDGDSGNYRVLLPLIKSFELPVTIFAATRQIQAGAAYWFDRVINAVQGKAILRLDLRDRGLSNYEVNKYHGPRNWNEIERLLADLKRLPPASRNETVEHVMRLVSERPKEDFSQISPLSVTELKELASCPHVTIGAHSHCHNILTQLTDEEVRRSVIQSKELLESWTGKPVEGFAYPNGDYDDRVAEIVREAGFKYALATTPRPWKRGDSLFAIPRISVGRYDSCDRFKIKLFGGMNQILPWRKS